MGTGGFLIVKGYYIRRHWWCRGCSNQVKLVQVTHILQPSLAHPSVCCAEGCTHSIATVLTCTHVCWPDHLQLLLADAVPYRVRLHGVYISGTHISLNWDMLVHVMGVGVQCGQVICCVAKLYLLILVSIRIPSSIPKMYKLFKTAVQFGGVDSPC